MHILQEDILATLVSMSFITFSSEAFISANTFSSELIISANTFSSEALIPFNRSLNYSYNTFHLLLFLK